MTKLEIIQLIENRIINEHNKHPDLDWAKIAEHKIYSSLSKQLKQDIIFSDIQPSHKIKEVSNSELINIIETRFM